MFVEVDETPRPAANPGQEGNKKMTHVKKYYVKQNYRFNLESMLVRVMNLIDDIRDGEFETVELMGETMDVYRLDDFKEEIEDLIAKAYGQVCGKDYGRIKAISDARNTIRYANCKANGMSETNGGYCFFD